MFGTNGVVQRRLVAELGPLRPAKTVVKAFEIEGECASIGSLLVNDVTVCTPGEAGACLDRMVLTSKLVQRPSLQVRAVLWKMPPGALNPIQLFMQAAPIGKAVLLLLLAASIWCWVLIIESAFGVARLRRAVAASRRSDRATGGLLGPVAEAGRQAASLSIPGESLGEARARVS